MNSQIEFGDENLLCKWEYQGQGSYRCELYHIGTDHVGYRFYCNDTLVFEGNDYRPSPMWAYDSAEALFGLLGFLSLKPGDTDDEYFEKYNREQMQFAETFAEDLSLCVCDFENDDNEADRKAEVLEGFQAA